MARTKNTQERISFANSSAAEREALVKHYEPLVNKLVNQFYRKLKNVSWDDLKSLAYEGLVLALNGFDPDRSEMKFTQFAAFAIRNNILTGLNNELRTVRMSAYMQTKVSNGEESGSVFNTVSMTTICGETGYDDNVQSREGRYGLYETAKFADGDPIGTLVQVVRDNFNEREQHMFFAYYGLAGVQEMQVNELAKMYEVTSGRVSQVIKKVVKFIQHDPDMLELLASMLEK